MRLPKIALVAAACAMTSLTARAQVRPVTILGPAETVTAVGGGGTLSAIDNVVYNPAGGGTIAITPGETLVIFSEYATTVDAAFLELGDTAAADLQVLDGVVYKTDAISGLPTGGNVVKQGGGILQVNSWTGLTGSQRTGTWWRDADGSLGYAYPLSAASWFTGGDNAPDLQPSVTDDPDGRNTARLNGLQGTFTIDQGTVRLAGFLNVWHDQGDNDTVDPLGPLPPPPRYTIESVAQDPLLSPRMTGVTAIVLNGSSVLELTNSPLNVPTGNSTTVTQGNALRVQYLRNLKAGEDNDQFQTDLVLGTTSEYRAVIHIEQGTTGSIGTLSGAGSVAKTGAGEFIVLNESSMTGSVTVGGGRLVLDSADGRALATAASVNLAGLPDADNRFITSGLTNGSRNGAHVRYLEQEDIDVNNDGAPDSLYKPAYAPAPGTRTLSQSDGGTWSATVTGAELEIRGDQLIRNFQSDFALAAAPDATGTIASAIQRAADVTNRGELIIAGTGEGASVILGGHTLTIRQDKGRDGVYQGSILAGFEYAAELADEGAGAYTVAFDRTPGFGTFQLRVTDADGVTRLTDATDISSADEIRANVAAALGVAATAVTVTDATAELGAALGWRIAVGAAGSVDAAANLNAGRVVLDATDDAAKLALILPVGGATFAETEVRRGSLIINAQGLGTSRINVSTGELRIYQTDTASLEASLLGAGTVRLVASALVDNGSGTDIEINSEEAVGTLNFAQQQLGFRGELIVNDGIDVSLSASAGAVTDTLLNARAITLDSGTGTRGSSLRFNGTDQVVRNLAGDARSRIELERGTMTLVQEDSTRTFLGQITGVGSVLKRGAGSFNLRGVNDLGVGASDFTGALAVQQGTVTLGSANAIRNVSALALAQGAAVTSAGRSQRIGALFGEAGSLLDIGAATLTVGVTPGRQADLRQQLQTSFGLQTTLSHNYLGTTDAAYDFLTYTFGGDLFTLTPADLDRGPLRLDEATEDEFRDGTLGMADQTRLYLESVLFRFDRDGDGAISAGEEALATATAGTLGFAGRLVATGANQTVAFGGASATRRVSLSKTGWETLRLLNDASGAQGNAFGNGWIVVRQGVLEATAGALATADTIVVLANSGTIDLDGDGISEAADLDGDTVLDGVDLNADGVFDETDREADGTLALFVGAGADTTFARVVAGDGNLVKTGDGRLVLASVDSQGRDVAQYTGFTGVVAGELELTLRRASANPAVTDATLGAAFVGEGAVLSLRTDSATSGAGTDFTYVAPDGIVGEGTLRKLGRGTLSVSGDRLLLLGGTLTDDLGEPLATLGLDVREGKLRVTDIADDDTLPSLGELGRAAVSSGATLELVLDADADAELDIELSGAGTFLRTGAGVLALSSDGSFAAGATAGSLGFTGSLSLRGGETELTDAGSFANATVAVANAGTILRLGAGAYGFAGLSGEVGTEFALDAATVLTLDVTTPAGSLAPRLDTFLGRFTGEGDLLKTGDGILVLDPGAVANDLGDITVSAGTLRATVAGIGSGAATSIQVLAGATLEFSVAEGLDETYTAAITGAGSVAKFGAGRILLSGTAALPSGTIAVNQGTLAIDDTRVGGVIPAATVASGATLEVILSDNRGLQSQVTGAGNLRVSGPFAVTFLNAPSFGGFLSLAGGADAAFDGSLTAIQLGGLEADSGSDVTLGAGQTLTLAQTASTDFEGRFLGTGNLVIRASGTGENVFRYLADGGDLSGLAGTVTVDGGALQVGGANTKAVTLTNGGDLHINVEAPDEDVYGGAIAIASGTSVLVKVGDGTLDLTSGLPATTGSGTLGGLVVREGRALVGVSGGGLLGGGQISLADTGSIAVSVALGETVSLTQQVATDGTAGGQFEKIGAGTLILRAGTASADVLVTAGRLQLGVSGSPTTVGGSVEVASGATLSGAATIAGDLSVSGIVAPGFSPGTLVVVGDLDLGAGSLFDAEALGSSADRIEFDGSLTISPTAALRLTGDSPVGSRFTLLDGGTVPAGTNFAAGQRLTAKTGDAEAPLGYLLEVREGAGGRIDAIIVRASTPTGPSAPLVGPGQVSGISPVFLGRMADLARVEVDPVPGVVTEADRGADGVALTPLGRRLAALSEGQAPAAIKSLTGIAYLSGIGMAHLSAAADNEALARRTEQRRYDRGYMSVKSREFFVSATSGSWDSDGSPGAPGYDISRTGLLVGWDKDFGPDVVAGLALSLDRSEAKLGGGGSVEATQARLHAFGSLVFSDEATFLEGGAFLGHSRQDANRGAFAGGVTASPTAFASGAWVRLGRAGLLAPRTSVVPFLQLDLSHASQGGFTESGPDDSQTKLAVDDLSQTDLRGRLGVSFAQAWDNASGDWRYRLSLDVAYVADLSGGAVTTSASNDSPDGVGDVVATADPLDRGGLLLTPALTFGPDHDTSYGISAEIRRLDGGDATSLNFTYRRRF